MSQTVPVAPTTQSARAWYDEALVEDAMVYDITREAATVLSSLLLTRMSEATDDGAREHWAARRRLVKQQTKALDPADRAGLIAQQQAWVHEAQALTDLPLT